MTDIDALRFSNGFVPEVPQQPCERPLIRGLLVPATEITYVPGTPDVGSPRGVSVHDCIVQTQGKKD
jgi:hypothetical protein